jgi:hypothetical protein
LLSVVGCGCGPAPEARAPTGTLVVFIRQGPEKVPFHPSLARIDAARAQLGELLDHGVEIEVDGALLPQTQDGADATVANVVETLARDLDDLREHEPRAFAFAKENLERLVVRYAPGVAAERGRETAVLDTKAATIDVARPRAGARALEGGDAAGAILRAFEAGETARYADASPDRLPAFEHRAWFEFQMHRRRRGNRLDALGAQLHGSLKLAALTRDPALAKDVRAWLVRAAGEIVSVYFNQPDAVESSPPGSPFRIGEADYERWLASELPKMSADERSAISRVLFIGDPRVARGDRFSTAAFTTIDRHAFYFSVVDAWIRDGHPPRDASAPVASLYGGVVCPFVVERDHGVELRRSAGRCQSPGYYDWALADPSREDAFVKGVLARSDPKLTAVVFYATRGARRDVGHELRFLRRFEGAPAHWSIGADDLVERGGRPPDEVIEEGRRLWRTSPAFRPGVLRWFALRMYNAYDQKEWADLLQGTLLDDAGLAAYLERGPEAFRLLPAAWPALAKGGRARTIVAKLGPILDGKTRPEAGQKDAAGTLVDVAHLLCDERADGELAEIHAFAERELPRRPGQGLAAVSEESSPDACAKRLAERRASPSASPRPKPKPKPKRSPALMQKTPSKGQDPGW